MDKLLDLLILFGKAYTKIKRKVRREDVEENTIDNFANKFGDPQRLRDDKRMQQRRTETKLVQGTKRRSDT
ncbi:hypothetical protein ABKY54_004168 [Vibrio harveyi]